MDTTRKTWPGSTGIYSTDFDTDTLVQLLTPRKLPGKPRPRVDRRVYPKHIEGESTRAYVERYFRMNSVPLVDWRNPVKWNARHIRAYPDDTNQHLALYHPLSTARQYTPADPIEETIE
jgi:hypothetical protein